MTRQNPNTLGEASLGQAVNFLNRLFRTLETWQAMHCERRKLLALDDRLLKDIAISRADAVREASRPFWDVPVERRAKQMDGAESSSCRPPATFAAK